MMTAETAQENSNPYASPHAKQKEWLKDHELRDTLLRLGAMYAMLMAMHVASMIYIHSNDPPASAETRVAEKIEAMAEDAETIVRRIFTSP